MLISWDPGENGKGFFANTRSPQNSQLVCSSNHVRLGGFRWKLGALRLTSCSLRVASGPWFAPSTRSELIMPRKLRSLDRPGRSVSKHTFIASSPYGPVPQKTTAPKGVPRRRIRTSDWLKGVFGRPSRPFDWLEKVCLLL